MSPSITSPKSRLAARSYVAAAVAAVALAAAPSAAAVGWVTGDPVSAPSEFAANPRVAVSPTGDRFVAWVREGSGGSSTLGLAVRVAPAGGDFGPVQLFPDVNADDPTLTVGSDGTAALVWSSGNSIRVATRAPGGGAFTEAAPFALGADPDAATVAMHGGDVLIAVPTDDFVNNAEVSTIQALRLTRGGTTLTRLSGTGPGGVLAQASSPSGLPAHEVDSPTIAVAGDQLHVVWEDRQSAATGGTGVTIIEDASGPAAGATLSAPAPVISVPQPGSTSAPSVFPVVATGGGHVDVAFVTPSGAVLYEDLAGSTEARTVTSDQGGFDLRAAVDETGTLVLAWQRFTAGDRSSGAYSAIVPASGPPGPVVRLTAPNDGRRLDDLVLGPDGSALALTDLLINSGGDHAASDPQAAFRAPGGAFGALEAVTGPRDRVGSSARFDVAAGAIGADGTTLAATAANDGSGTPNERIFVSERDATPPAIGSVAVPATATVGDSVTMSAQASDALSPVTLTWDFGDGSQATGASVRHTYGIPGDHVVTVRAVDGAGNAATVTRTVTVSSPNTAPRLSQLTAAQTRGGTVASVRVDEQAILVFSLTGRGGRHAISLQPIIRSAGRAGRVTATFRAHLPHGSYRLSVRAIDAAGNHSQPASVHFTVAAR
jgi:hypothetical protein